MRKLGWVLSICSVLAILAELCDLQLPTLSWAFNISHKASYLHSAAEDGGKVFAWFGYLVSVVGLALGVYWLVTVPKGRQMLPSTKRRVERFMSIPRGYISLGLILFMVFLAGLDQALVGKRALYMNYEGEVSFPAFERKVKTGGEIGLTGEAAGSPVNYRELKKKVDASGEGSIIMPLVPFDPTEDPVLVPSVELEERDGKLLAPTGELMRGRVFTFFDGNSELQHMTYEYRKGVRSGRVIGKNRSGEPVYEAEYKDGKLIAGSEKFSGEGTLVDFLASGDGKLSKNYFHSAPPLPSQGHLLGTTSQGDDLLAYLYGGLQVNIKAALVYVPIIYFIGVSIGLLMGFFGGAFDLVVQRIIEIFSTIPFLFVVIIFSSIVPSQNRGLGIILLILILFGWMGMTYLMRTAAMKEKARDYVAAARVSGASTSRIIFTHILPNTVAVLVTLVPFSVSGIIMSLTALDYLGFGLPPEYATWGRLLGEGLQNLSKPWLVTSSFSVLVITLILVTFVGEAVRDAFDPKKFTTYK